MTGPNDNSRDPHLIPVDSEPTSRPDSSGISSFASEMLRLTLVEGLGPVTIVRALVAFGSPRAVLDASIRDLAQLQGVGERKAEQIRRGLDRSDDALRAELELAESLNVRIVARGEAEYPPLLEHTPSAPVVLYARGGLDPSRDLYSVGIVGSRRATHYGVEQTARFSLALAQSGLTIVSGGARGVDTSAHRAALQASDGRTVAVLGCGLANCYPPENAALFDEIVARGGAILSELPLRTGPNAENFPARNRIISGMSLGVLVIEAPTKSGALITARYAAEDQGREVLAVPGRVDSQASEGTNELIKTGSAAMATCPKDVIDALENVARHAHAGSHGLRTRAFASTGASGGDALFTPETVAPKPDRSLALRSLTDRQRTLLGAIGEGRSVDRLVQETGFEAATILADATILEVQGLLKRRGDGFVPR
jgi:DNA processing protein